MIDLMAVYECPRCGDVLEDEVYYHEHIDTDNDEIYPAYHCNRCNRMVKPKTQIIDGQVCQVLQSVDPYRMMAAAGYFDDEDY